MRDPKGSGSAGDIPDVKWGGTLGCDVGLVTSRPVNMGLGMKRRIVMVT